MSNASKKLLIAASGTGGHLFPAIALAQQLPDYKIEWLGVPNRLETQLVPKEYPLHAIEVEGFQQRFGLGTLGILLRLTGSIRYVRELLKEGQFDGLFSTGGYIAAPAIIAARSLGLPAIMHESNALPGKVTRWLSPWCTKVAIGFEYAAHYLPRTGTVYVGTPVRSQFLSPQKLDLPIPDDAFLIAIAGGSQGAVAVNQLVRQCAPAWIEAGAWIVHQTGDNDPEAQSFQHPHYFSLPFYSNMAGLLQRANLAISRAGAGTLTELAVTKTPAILIPYPFAAEDHQVYNAQMFASTEAALVFRQSEITPELLETKVLNLMRSPAQVAQMAQRTGALAVTDSAERLAQMVREMLA
ncbi:undecaprenyldiphospho-muramoylpentapeptide beta-N-acetylglucosaminyltransferase [Microcoleus sp. FACHB-831]|uniref:undecaprenyldiphospho-muramoylpentapeptide beta-N-acetylglucosaminyltransferase n=1 Tax=Microcoleus sp. FACHB-831 TaxID=2692827 RepID=UPI001687745F|nr:undecaprenyldiphospho-muramoylpentapeptide beta-N-acetylglucosaminyltransferase [Microcoleus sp. FACHB-831]MBD1920762.1 undecaprenyldiphospho-muramoylpentapeptide beta-N-acetylglucosaminyltransferase [Microcoleus sp. FACHB-831]